MEKAEMKIAVDGNVIHRRHHLVARYVIGPVRHAVPRPLRRVRLIGVDLGIDDHHRASSSLISRLYLSRSRPCPELGSYLDRERANFHREHQQNIQKYVSLIFRCGVAADVERWL
jgi:hypothetical protein